MLNFRNAWTLGSFLALGACAAESDDTGGNADSGTDDTATGASMTEPTTTATETDSASSGADTTTGGEAGCFGAGGPNKDTEACVANDDCLSGVCLIYTDAPLNADAVCGQMPAMSADGCNTRITGTLFDFSTRMPIEGATMKAAAALQAITSPSGADAIVSATSGADGRIDATSEKPISAAIAIIALVEAPGFFLTATGLASPAEEGGSAYNVGVGNHDLWTVPTASLDTWSMAMAADPVVLPELLPLGAAGGVVGFVRGPDGLPIAGAVVEAVEPGGNSVIRYVAADDSIVSDVTSENGLFIIVGGAPLGEDFQASVGGTVVAGGRAGTANDVVFTLIMTTE